MTLEEFVQAIADELDCAETISAETNYKTLNCWDSLASLSIISMVDDEYGKTITGADVRARNSVKELYDYVESL